MRPADERPAAAREEHPQVGADLGDRADGAAAAGAEALLVDHDAGGDVPDRIDRRPCELRLPAAGVRAERLDELALRLGADRVEHERRLAAAAHVGEGNEPVLRHVDVDALEVVRAGASDLDGGHLRPSRRRYRAESSILAAGCAEPRIRRGKFMVWSQNCRRAGDLVANGGVATGSAADATDGVDGSADTADCVREPHARTTTCRAALTQAVRQRRAGGPDSQTTGASTSAKRDAPNTAAASPVSPVFEVGRRLGAPYAR